MRILRALAARVERYHHGYVAALCYMDFFKGYNDLYRHLAGDEVLKAVAATLASTARRGDAVYRYGGEEFLISCRADRRDRHHRARADRLAVVARDRRIGEPAGWDRDDQRRARIAEGRDDASVADWLRRADAALYAAKAAGRNRVAIDGRDGRPVHAEAVGEAASAA